MKFVKFVGFLFVGALILVACQKEYSVETGGLGGTVGSSQWEFRQGTINYKGTMDTATIDTVASVAYLTLSGVNDSGKQLISFKVFGTPLKAGTYTSPAVAFTYTDLSSNILYQSDVTATNFTLVIARIDSAGITGTFSGTVKDAAAATKIVSSGKFSAFFKKKTTTPPVSTDCKLEKIFTYDSIGVARGPITIFTFNTSTKIANKVQLVDSVRNLVFNTFNFSFPTNKVQLDAKQYFVTDANGRITEFHGYENPIDDTTDLIVAKYTYNTSGQLTQRKMAYASLPDTTVLQTDFTWSGNNMTKATGKVPVTSTLFLTVFDATYEYNTARTVKSFITLPAYAYEIAFFQSSVNSGAVPANPVTKTTTRYYSQTGSGAVTGTYICNFTKYLIDANNYVQSFVTTGDSFDEAFIFSGEKYAFGYKCF